MTQWGLDTLFNPAKRHMDEEKRRLQATRQQVGDTSGGKRIDLESGKVRIGKAADGGDDVDDSDELEDGPEDAEFTAEQARPAEEKRAADRTPKDGSAKNRSTKDRSAKDRSAKSRDGKGEPEPSPAAVRAAQRRGRTPR